MRWRPAGQGRLSDEVKARSADKERIQANTKGLEDRLKNLEAKYGSKMQDGGMGNIKNAGSDRIGV